MNQIATQEQSAPAPVVRFKRNLGRLIEGGELALPSNVTTEAFKNAAIVAVQDNPKILGCEEASLFKAIRTLAASGLVPDGREAALVPFNTWDPNTRKKVAKCQAMPMVFGLVKMARRSGTVTDIRAHIVYANEVEQGRFTYQIGDEEVLKHDPILFGEKGAPVGCYAIARLKDGSLIREFMSAQEVDKVRRSGSSQLLFEQGQKPTVSNEPIGIWADWAESMWKKSVIRRLCKRLDLSAEDVRRIVEDEDHQALRDVTPEESKPQSFAARANAAREAAQQEAAPEDETQEPAEEQPETPQEDAQEVEDAEVVQEDPEGASEPERAAEEADGTDPAETHPADFRRGERDHGKGIPINEVPSYLAKDQQRADAWRAGHLAAEAATGEDS